MSQHTKVKIPNHRNPIAVKTHIKPTNKQLYVHASSYHPPATKLAIAKGEAKRYLRTNSTKQHFDGMQWLNSSNEDIRRKKIEKQINQVKFETRKTKLQWKFKSV